MCLFAYFIYDDCGHKGIEVVSHCAMRLWEAGIDGQLWACPEVQYIRHITELSSLTWEGRYGYCKCCHAKYAMPETVSCRSLNDLVIPAEMPQTASPAEGPYIYTPCVTKTVPELLGIEDQIPYDEMGDGCKIDFPSNLDTYDRTEAGGSFQWLSQGWSAGTRVGPLISAFSLRNGMTFRDQSFVAEALVQGRLLAMWRQEFERRGMPWIKYLAQARLVAQSIGVSAFEPSLLEEIDRSYVAEQDGLSKI